MLRRASAAGALVWAFALPLATWIASRPDPGWPGPYAFALTTYSLASLICHQRPERSFAAFGVQLPVCARCVGLYTGAAVAAVVAFSRNLIHARRAASGARRTWVVWNGRDAKAALAACALPTAATIVYEWSTGSTPSNVARAVSALPLGACVGWLLWGGGAGWRQIN
jgi:hypothetical protein